MPPPITRAFTRLDYPTRHITRKRELGGLGLLR
jgi:hypothetical protein